MRPVSVDKVRAGPWIVLMAIVSLLIPCAVMAADGDFMTAKIPFDFVVDGTTLPAGTYKVVVEPGAQDLPGVLAIQTAYESENEPRFRKVFTSTKR